MIEYITIFKLIDEWIKLTKSKKEEELKSKDWKDLEKEYMQHLQWRFSYPKKVFGQQIIYSWILTILVIVLVISGLVFSFIQLTEAIRLGNLSSLSTDLAIETAGKLSMSSSIVGAVVLAISLVFFNLYLKYVFKIQHIIPPHISITETDAPKIMDKLNDKPTRDKDSIDITENKKIE